MEERLAWLGQLSPSTVRKTIPPYPIRWAFLAWLSEACQPTVHFWCNQIPLASNLCSFQITICLWELGLWITSMSWPLIVTYQLTFFGCWDYQKPLGFYVNLFPSPKKNLCLSQNLSLTLGSTYCNSFYANFSNWAESGVFQIKPLNVLIPSQND